MKDFSKKFFNRLKLQRVGKGFRKKFRNKIESKRLINSNFTILSNNCIGGVIYHDLGQKFLSPTINLYITPSDFVKFLENLDYYLNLDIIPIKSNLKYPVGKMGDIILYFKHYNSIEEAIEKWNERKKRINMDNIYIMMTDRWCCPYEVLKRFGNLKFKNKICFTYRDYKEFPFCKKVTKWKDDKCVGVITDVANIFGKRLYQYAKNFNYIDWLNK